jgi:multidrug efflux pump subunit AcrA (membrane-fusion protein)
VTKKKIETGLKYDGEIEVVSGLVSGDIIVREGSLTLKDGAKIKIKPTKK